MHVIYLDDEEKSLVGLRRSLSPLGMSVACCSTVESLMAAAPHSDVDVIVLDYELGHTNGIAVYDALRERGVTTPCVLYTGRAPETVRIRAHERGFAAVVQKSTLSAREFAAILRKVAYAALTPPSRPAVRASSLDFDLETGTLSDGAEQRTRLRGQSAALFTFVVRHGPRIQRVDIAKKFFQLEYPEDVDGRRTVDDRISKAVKRLREGLGAFASLLTTETGYVELTAKVTITRSGNYPATDAADSSVDANAEGSNTKNPRSR